MSESGEVETTRTRCGERGYIVDQGGGRVVEKVVPCAHANRRKAERREEKRRWS
jgi:hypothetical protein